MVNAKTIYEFDGYVLDESRQSLYYQNVEIRLTKRNFDVLALLVKKNGIVIEKQEFHETVWADTFVEDGNLAVSVNVLRKIFETHSKQSFIETYSRRGYKFSANVKTINKNNDFIPSSSTDIFDISETEKNINITAENPLQHVTPNDTPLVAQEALLLTTSASNSNFSNLLTKRSLIFSFIFITLVASSIYFYNYQSGNNVANISDYPKIAVVPFTNLKPDSNSDYLGVAFSEAIINDLNIIPNFDVARVSEIKSREDINTLIAELKEKRKVDLAIVGSYLILENEIEISARLINVSNNTTLFEKTFKVLNKEISTIPRLVSNDIIVKLGLSGFYPLDTVLLPQNINQEAYQNYLKALALLTQNRHIEAAPLIEKVVLIEPTFYGGWYILANNYISLAQINVKDADKYYAKAIETAEKMQSLDPNNPQAKLLLAAIYTDTNRLQEALQEFKSLPNNEIDHAARLRLKSYIARYGGLLDESINFSQASIKLTRKSRIFQPQLYYNGEYEKFKQSGPMSIDEPTYFSFYLGLISIYENKPNDIRKNFQDSRTYYGNSYIGEMSQAILLHLDNRTDEGLQILQRAEKTFNNLSVFDSESLYLLVQVYAYLGDTEAALRTFKKTVDGGFFCYPYFLKDPILNNLRNDQRFQETLEVARQKHLKFKELFYAESNN